MPAGHARVIGCRHGAIRPGGGRRKAGVGEGGGKGKMMGCRPASRCREGICQKTQLQKPGGERHSPPAGLAPGSVRTRPPSPARTRVPPRCVPVGPANAPTLRANRRQTSSPTVRALLMPADRYEMAPGPHRGPAWVSLSHTTTIYLPSSDQASPTRTAFQLVKSNLFSDHGRTAEATAGALSANSPRRVCLCLTSPVALTSARRPPARPQTPPARAARPGRWQHRAPA